MLLWKRYVNNMMAAMRFLHLQQYSHRLNLLYVLFLLLLISSLRGTDCGAKGFVGPNMKEQVQLINIAAIKSVPLQQLTYCATQQISRHSRNLEEHYLTHNSTK